MAKTAQEIYDEILAHIKSEGGKYNTWYAGITSNIESRLFSASGHGVPKKDHWFIWRESSSAANARNVEDALHRLGFDGGPGGGDDTCVYVYCYKKTSITDP